jgi:hypothetical protein
MTETVHRLSTAGGDDVLARAVRAANATDPSAAELQRIGELVTAEVAKGAALSGAAWRAARLLRGGSVLGLVAIGSVAYWLAVGEGPAMQARPSPEARASDAALPPRAVEAPAPVVVPRPEPVVEPEPANRASPRRTTTRTPATGEVPSELDLLRAAEASLDGDPRAALARTDEHLAAYPRGVLAQEREYLAIDALVRLGRHADAAERARRFEAQHPASPLRRRLTRLIGPARPFGNEPADRTSTEGEGRTEP